jgi:acetylornithine deacetylase/succinyl-diaminopimelate desuccinylase-like protein
MLNAALKAVDDGFEASLDRLFALLRIESISTDPAFAPRVRAAAEWLAAELAALGFGASVRPTGGHPMVVAHDREAAAGPHVLFYAHYDVQPVDPLSEWTSPPFEPRVVSVGGVDCVLARGASDDKGQLMTFLEACRAWKTAAGKLPVRISILFEGEEESGSPSLPGFLTANAEELRADVALVCDTAMWSRERPAVTIMLRGLVGEEIIVTAANRDLHSGMYGGAARNPNHVVADILAGLHDQRGRVTLPGFYDGVHETPPELRTLWEGLGFDPGGFLGAVGLSVPAGESGRTVLEQIWWRPTVEVNGMTGGYTGQGFKTVIPSRASAKVSFRLVGDQDPARIRESFRTYVRERVPGDCQVDFIAHGASPALRLPHDSEFLRRTARALADEWGIEPALIGSGGSIPVVGMLKRTLGMDSLMVGFALDDDRIHSPNEKYDVASFRGGIRSWARILAALAE